MSAPVAAPKPRLTVALRAIEVDMMQRREEIRLAKRKAAAEGNQAEVRKLAVFEEVTGDMIINSTTCAKRIEGLK